MYHKTSCLPRPDCLLLENGAFLGIYDGGQIHWVLSCACCVGLKAYIDDREQVGVDRLRRCKIAWDILDQGRQESCRMVGQEFAYVLESMC